MARRGRDWPHPWSQPHARRYDDEDEPLDPDVVPLMNPYQGWEERYPTGSSYAAAYTKGYGRASEPYSTRGWESEGGTLTSRKGHGKESGGRTSTSRKGKGKGKESEGRTLTSWEAHGVESEGRTLTSCRAKGGRASSAPSGQRAIVVRR